MISWLADKIGFVRRGEHSASSGDQTFDFIAGSQYYTGEGTPGAITNPTYYKGPHWYNYYKLRALSRMVFIKNPYIAPAISRLVTLIVHTGLRIEADPMEILTGLFGIPRNKWKKKVEQFYRLWGKDGQADWSDKDDLGTMEQVAQTEAFVEGDILRVVHFDEDTNLPRIELISGR